VAMTSFHTEKCCHLASEHEAKILMIDNKSILSSPLTGTMSCDLSYDRKLITKSNIRTSYLYRKFVL